MSMELHVFFGGKLPSKARLQTRLRELGFPLSIKPATGSLDRQTGYMPMVLARKDETGIEFDIFDGRDTVEEYAKDAHPRLDRSANFRWGSDAQEMMVAFSCAAALAQLVDGLIFDPQEGRPVSVEEAIAVARDELAKTLSPQVQARPGTRPSDIKRYLKPLLKLRGDLVLRGRLLLIRPVRHLLRGALFDRTSDKHTFQIWRYFSPLYDDRHGVGYGDSFYMTVWQPYFEPLLLDTINQDVLDRVARMVALADFENQVVERGPFMKARARALILAGERDRAVAFFDECERRWPQGAQFWNIAEERALLDRDIHAVCEEHHRREAKSAKELKLDGIWEPTPFPAELPAMRRSEANEAAFKPEPWVARPDWLLGAAPAQTGAIVFSKSAVSRGGKATPLVPISRIEAQERHNAYDSYCLFCRLSEDELMVLHRRANVSPHDPNPLPLNEFGRTSTNLDLSIYRGAGRLHAVFWELSEAPGSLRIFTIDWRGAAREPRGWHLLVQDRERMLDYHEHPHVPERRLLRQITDEEFKVCRIAIPAFGEFNVLLEHVNACLSLVGQSSERVTLKSLGTL